MDLTVTLEPHVGERFDNEVGLMKVTHDQWMVMVSSPQMKQASGRDKMHVGYVGVRPGMPINFLPSVNRFGKDGIDKIAARVKELILEVAEAATKAADPEVAGAAKSNLKQEAATKRKHFSPPTDQLMEAAAPDGQASAGDDDVEALL